MRWIGWLVVAAVLGAMTFARVADDKDRRGREPDTRPIVGTPSEPGPEPVGGERASHHRAEASPESL